MKIEFAEPEAMDIGQELTELGRREYNLSSNPRVEYNSIAGWPPFVNAVVHHGEAYYFESTSGQTWSHHPMIGLHGPEGCGDGPAGEDYTVPDSPPGILWSGAYIDGDTIRAHRYDARCDRSRGGTMWWVNRQGRDWEFCHYINDKSGEYEDNLGSLTFKLVVVTVPV